MVITAPQPMSRQIEDQDTRVEDYLNDKIQTHADLDNLDSLLKTVREQQKVLQGQVGTYIIAYRFI